MISKRPNTGLRAFGGALLLCAGSFFATGCIQDPAPETKSELAVSAAISNTTITLTSPLPSGKEFWFAGETMALTAVVSNPTLVVKVEFFRDGAKIGETYKSGTSAVFAFNYNQAIPGGYNYTAKLIESNGNTRTSSLLPISVWYRNYLAGPYDILDMKSFRHQIIINAGTQKIRDIRIRTSITHTYDSDVSLKFHQYGGGVETNVCSLTNGLGGSGDNFSVTTFRDDAPTSITAGQAPFNGNYKPQQSLLTKYWGKNATDWYYVAVADIAPTDVGTLHFLEVLVKVGP